MSQLHKQYLDSFGIQSSFKSEIERYSDLVKSFDVGLYSNHTKDIMKIFDDQYKQQFDSLQENITTLIVNTGTINSELYDRYEGTSSISNMIKNAQSTIQSTMKQLSIATLSDYHLLFEKIDFSPYISISSNLHKQHIYELESITASLDLKSLSSITHSLDLSKFEVSLDTLIKKRIEKYSFNDIVELNATLQQIDNKLAPYNFSEKSIESSDYNWITREMLIALISLLISLAYGKYLSTQSDRLLVREINKFNTMQVIQREREIKKQNYYLGTKLDRILLKKNIVIYYQCLRSHVRMRSKPSTSQSRVLIKLMQNAKLILLQRDGQWAECEYFDKINQRTFIGWVHIRNFKRIEK